MRQDPPCEFYLNSKTIKLPNEKSLFEHTNKGSYFFGLWAQEVTVDLNIIRKGVVNGAPLENILDYNWTSWVME